MTFTASLSPIYPVAYNKSREIFVPDKSYNEQDFALARLVNQGKRAEGPTLPPRAVGGIRIPSVSNLKIVKTLDYWGGTEFTLTWLEPDDVIGQVDSYAIYVRDLFATNNEPVGVWGGRRSPAVVRVNTDTTRRVIFFCQTILKNGYSNDISNAPSVTGIASGTSLDTSDLVIGAGNLTDANRIVLVDSPNTVKQLGSLGTTTTVLHGNAAGAPSFGAVALGAGGDVTGTLPVANGGTGLTSGTSGGILGFTGATTLASSVLLTANALVLGAGAGATPTPLGSLGTTTTVLHGNAGGAPTFGAVSLTADVTGTLPVANGGTNKTSWTAGSIAFAGAGGTALTEDNTGLFYDDSNNRLGVGTTTPTKTVDVYATDVAIQLHNSVSGTGATDGLELSLDSPTPEGFLWNFETGALRFGTSNTERLSILSSGEVGAGVTAPVSTLETGGSLGIKAKSIVVGDSPYTAASEVLIHANATGGNITVNLPALSGVLGRVYIIKKTDASANTVTIDGNGAETIDDSGTKVLTAQYETARIIATSGNWFVV